MIGSAYILYAASLHGSLCSYLGADLTSHKNYVESLHDFH